MTLSLGHRSWWIAALCLAGGPAAAQEVEAAAPKAPVDGASPADNEETLTGASPEAEEPKAGDASVPADAAVMAPATSPEAAAPAPSTAAVEAAAPVPSASTEEVADTGEAAPDEAPPVRTASAVTAPAETVTPTPGPPSGPRRRFGLLGPGIGIGCFYPQEVNDYIENWKDLQQAEIESGVTGMFYHIVPKVSFVFGPIEYIQIEVVGEVGWSPKFLAISGGQSGVFHYMRYSGGGTVTGHLPLKNGKYALFSGAGALFHYLRFEDYSAWAPGARGVLGFRMYRKRVIPEIFIAFDWVRTDSDQEVVQTIPLTTDDGPAYRDEARQIEMDYTGVTLGANFYFQLFGG